MKKIIALLLVLCMCFSLCSCGQDDNSSTETENRNVTLAESNISDFLNVRLTPYTVEDEGYWDRDVGYVKVEIYPIQAGNFSNTEFSLTFQMLGGNGASADDIKIDGEKYKILEWNIFEVDILLPSSGNYEFVINLSHHVYSTSDALEKWEYKNVSGTFIPN